MKFIETQRFPDWLRYSLLLLNAIIIYVLFQTEESSTPIFIILLLSIIIPGTIFQWTQKTEINSSNIKLTIKPFISKQIPFSDLESWSVRTYKPIKEYGGWGIRFGRNGTAYNISGNKGLQLVLKNGKKILIGTQKDSELNRVMKSISPDKEHII